MLVEFLIAVAGQVAAHLPTRMLASAVEERELEADILNAVKRAEKHFVSEYAEIDRELVELLTVQIEIAEEEGLKNAIRNLLMRPFHDPSESTNNIRQSFSDVLPSFSDRGRVDKAVDYFLKCLGREVLYIRQLGPVYSLFLQKKGLDNSASIVSNTSEMVELLKGVRHDLELPRDLKANLLS